MPVPQREERSAEPFVPEQPTLSGLREAAARCTGCDLYQRATQTVFGEGPEAAVIMLVGEQPGDQEDIAGRPFVGPAGRLLDRALEEAGIPRERTYVTNAVKHFKWTARGKRRLHEKPNMAEINACRPWLAAEIEVVKPRMVVCLGATAGQALMGPAFRITRHRGEVLRTPWAPALTATVHPSSLLRIPDDEERERAFEAFVADLRVAAQALDPEWRGVGG